MNENIYPPYGGNQTLCKCHFYQTKEHHTHSKLHMNHEHAAHCCKEVAMQPSHLQSNQSASLLSIPVISFKYIMSKYRPNFSEFLCASEQHCHHGNAYGGPSTPVHFSVILTLCDWTSVTSHILLLPFRWHYNPMQTPASFMDYSQPALFLDLSFQFVILHLLILVCTQFNHLFFGGPISHLP
jgi:hypothetical protein